MQETFALEDIFNVMIELESLGNVHYSKMKELTSDYKLKELFDTLAKQENKHKVIYSQFKEKAVSFNHNIVNEDYKEYMDALLQNTIAFVKGSYDVADFEQGYNIAIGFEKDTILFLSELRAIIDPEFYDEINVILGEERNHLKFLYDHVK